MSSNIQNTKKLLEQLHRECNIQRLPVSQTINEMIAYAEQYKGEDTLLTGIDKKQNPFQEKTSCEIL